MTTERMYLLQAIGFFLQSVNAGLSGVIHSSMVTLLVSSFVGAYQLYVGHLGIQMDPQKKDK